MRQEFGRAEFCQALCFGLVPTGGEHVVRVIHGQCGSHKKRIANVLATYRRFASKCAATSAQMKGSKGRTESGGRRPEGSEEGSEVRPQIGVLNPPRRRRRNRSSPGTSEVRRPAKVGGGASAFTSAAKRQSKSFASFDLVVLVLRDLSPWREFCISVISVCSCKNPLSMAEIHCLSQAFTLRAFNPPPRRSDL